MKKLFLLLFVASLANASWDPHADAIGSFGNYRKGGGVVLFAPVESDGNHILFAQGAIGHFRDMWAGSLGLGYRQLVADWVAVGGSFFGDWSRDTLGNDYAQWGLGVEALGRCWSLRSNGYFPGRGLRSFDRAQGINTLRTLHHVYSGFDVELGGGYQIGKGQAWGYATYYRFSGHDVVTLEGPRLRAEYRFDNMVLNGSELTFAAEWDHNRRHGSTVAGFVAIRVPLSGGAAPLSSSCCDSVCRQMGERVRREYSIWVEKDLVFIAGMEQFLLAQLFFIQNGALNGASGTQADPMNVDEAYFKASDDNDVLFFLADGGDIMTSEINGGAGGTLLLRDNIQGVGFGGNPSTIIRFQDGSTLVVNALASGARPTVVGNGTNPLFTSTATSNMVIQGLEMENGTAPEFINMAVGGSLRMSDVTNVTDTADLLMAMDIGRILIEDSTLDTGSLIWVQTAGSPTFTVTNSSLTSPARLFDFTITGPGTTATFLVDGGSVLVEPSAIQSMIAQTSADLNVTMDTVSGGPFSLDITTAGLGNTVDFLLDNVDIMMAGGWDLVSTAGATMTGSYTIQNCTFDAFTTNNFNFSFSSGSTVTVLVDSSMWTGTADTALIYGGEGMVNTRITNCDIDIAGGAATTGVISLAPTFTTAGTFFFDIDGNRIGQVSRVGNEAISVSLGGAVGPATVEGFVRNNMCTSNGSNGLAGVLISNGNIGAGNSYTVAVVDNTIDADTVPAVSYLGGAVSDLTINYTCSRNIATTPAVPGAVHAYTVAFLADLTGVNPCATIQGNSSLATTSAGIDIAAVPLASTDLDLTNGTPAGLGIDNPLVTTTPATVSAGVMDIGSTTCTLPVVPPIP